MSKLSYPKNEIVWVRYLDSKDNLRYIITSKSNREYYFLYKLTKDSFEKIARAKSPLDLEKKVKVK